jgi:transposase InsO family protein
VPRPALAPRHPSQLLAVLPYVPYHRRRRFQTDAAAALAAIDYWMEDYNTVHPHSRLGYRSPRSNPPRVRFGGVNSTTVSSDEAEFIPLPD